MPSSSLSKAEYFFSALDSFFEKKAMGLNLPLIFCSTTPPMAVSEASSVKVVSASFPGWLKSVTYDKASFAAVKATSHSGDHSMSLPFLLPTAECRGIKVFAMPGMNL